MKIKPEYEDIVIEGSRAFEDELNFADNPYSDNSNNFLWSIGWMFAEARSIDDVEYTKNVESLYKAFVKPEG